MIEDRCREFDAWLDTGIPTLGENAGAEMEVQYRHAQACSRCLPMLKAALAVEVALDAVAGTPPVAPRGFTDAVMARIAATRAPISAGLDWRLRALAQPATALAFTLAAVVFVGRDSIASWAVAAQVAVGHAVTQAAALLPGGVLLPGFDDPWTRLGLLLAVTPLVLLPSLALYRWSAQGHGPALARAAR